MSSAAWNLYLLVLYELTTVISDTLLVLSFDTYIRIEFWSIKLQHKLQASADNIFYNPHYLFRFLLWFGRLSHPLHLDPSRKRKVRFRWRWRPR